MARDTMKAAQERASEANRRAMLYQVALHLAVTSEIEHCERWRDDDDGHYFARLYGATRADGGVVVIVFCADGQAQHPNSWAIHVDDWCAARRAHRLPLPEAIACERIERTRNRIIEKVQMLRGQP